MVWITYPYKCGLGWITKSVLTANSKTGNTREELLHAWRSFHFDENTETLNADVTCIRQVATLLGYGKPQVLDIFKNTLLTRLYWVLIPIEDLRLAVEMAKRIFTKEKVDRQLAGYSSLTLFMNIKMGTVVRRFHLAHKIV